MKNSIFPIALTHAALFILTIELPFLNNKYQPDAIYGWSPKRSIEVGQKVLQPITKILKTL